MTIGLFIVLALIALLCILIPLIKDGLNESKTKFLFFVVPSFCLGTLFLYWQFGAYLLVSEKRTIDKLVQDLVLVLESQQTTRETLLAHFKKIEQHVHSNPIGLLRMAELYQEGGFYDEAIVLYEKLMVLSSDSESVLNWIYCYSLKDKGALPQAVRQRAQSLLSQMPDNMMLINLLAIDDYFHGRIKSAILGWKVILAKDKTLTPERRAVLINAIASSEKAASSEALKGIGFKVTVSINPNLIKGLSPQDSVFVYVRRPNEKRPILVIKHTVRELPLTITLDDRHAMLMESLEPGMQVEIGAHISKQGTALLKSGDIRGKMGPIIVKDGIENVSFEIAEIV